MRFYLDEDLSGVIARIGRERFGLDITSAHALGTEQATDEEQLAFAARERRCIVTRNERDFLDLTVRFLARGLAHPGVVMVPPSFTGSEFMLIARGLADLHAMYPEDTVPYLVIYIPHPHHSSSTPPVMARHQQCTAATTRASPPRRAHGGGDGRPRPRRPRPAL